jgi:hypothetical protein
VKDAIWLNLAEISLNLLNSQVLLLSHHCYRKVLQLLRLRCSCDWFCKKESVQEDSCCEGINLIHPSQALCPLCQVKTEHMQHLFLHCHGSWKF